MFILKNNYNPANAEGKTKWHCQADNNTFSLFHKGRNFFPDAGVYAYSGDPQRNVYEQTAWHNTITIFENNIDQMLGKFIYKGTDGNTNYIVTENAAYIQKETPKSDEMCIRDSFGGGSNFGGISFPFMRHTIQEGKKTRFVAAEPASCPKLTRGKFQYDFGDEAGYTPLLPMFTLGHNFAPAHIHAGGLRYHGAGVIVSQLLKDNLMEAVDIQQLERCV